MITLASKELVTINADVYVPYKDGDDIEAVYFHITLSDGYDCYIPAKWTPDEVKAECTAVIDRANAATKEAVVTQANLDKVLSEL